MATAADLRNPAKADSVDGGWGRFAAGIRGEGTAARRAWQPRYVQRTVGFDALCSLVAAVASYALWFGWGETDGVRPPLWIAAALPLVWLPALVVARTYEKRFLWVGVEEYRRVVGAVVVLLAAVGFLSLAFELPLGRGFVVVALPLVFFLTIASRIAHRQWLRHQRRTGNYQQTTLLVGHGRAVADLDEQLNRATDRGYRVIGCCLPAAQQSPGLDAFNGLPVLGRGQPV
jgi:FlaA1/EpsC-like NDP-sugar epimerase